MIRVYTDSKDEYSVINRVNTQVNVKFTMYSKTCLKRPLKNRQNKDLNDKK